MSLIGGYRLAGPSANASLNETIVNFVGYPVSGNSNTNALACCLFVWNATTKQWEPMTQP